MSSENKRESSGIDELGKITPVPKTKRKAKKPKLTGPRLVDEFLTAEALEAFGIAVLKNVETLPKNYYAYSERQVAPPMAGLKVLPAPRSNSLDSFVFVITGVLTSMERFEAENYIKACGGQVSKSVAKKVTHALVGVGCGQSKIATCDERGIPKLDEDALVALVEKIFERSNPKSAKDELLSTIDIHKSPTLDATFIEEQRVESKAYVSDEETFQLDDDSE